MCHFEKGIWYIREREHLVRYKVLGFLEITDLFLCTEAHILCAHSCLHDFLFNKIQCSNAWVVICTNQICDLTRQSLQLHLQTCMHYCVYICVLQQVVCLCFSSLWLLFSGISCSQSFLSRVNHMVCLHEASWHVCHIIVFYYLMFWSQEQINIVSLAHWDAQIQNLGIPRICLKGIWQRDLKTFQQECFLLSQEKFVLWRNPN